MTPVLMSQNSLQSLLACSSSVMLFVPQVMFVCEESDNTARLTPETRTLLRGSQNLFKTFKYVKNFLIWRTSLNWELRRKYYGDHYGDYGGNYGDLCGGPDLPDRLAGRGLIQNPLGLTYYMFICIILLHN
jgi:hypothetical protein